MATSRWTVTADDGGSGSLDLDGEALTAPSTLFLLVADGVPHERLAGTEVTADERTVSVTGSAGPLHVRWSARRVGGCDVWELTLTVRNDATHPVELTRLDPIAISPDGLWQTRSFRSAWGDEFRQDRDDTWGHLRLDVRSGRSSHGHSPLLVLERDAAGLLVAPAWSGNWHIDLEGGRLTAGISPWGFATVLAPGEELEAPAVVVAVGRDLGAASAQMQTAVATDWLPRSAASDAVPVEWNHWWPYEDAEVTESVILANAAVAARIGIEVSTVDAGWFGDADAASDWQQQRGDWDRVNTARFPSGLEALGEGIRAAGTQAGLWVEAEAVGAQATLRERAPELIAHAAPGWRRDPSYGSMTVSLDSDDPSFLGYVCLGSPQGRAHVAAALESAVTRQGAQWIKLDFNIDPDSGCARTDHGHGAHDGLLRHYQGLYAVLDDFREQHPEVILEACSSGGLRQDLGLARHVHCFFLSDPDHTEHHLQALWGSSLVLPPIALLHWSWSQWRGDYPPAQRDWDAVTAQEFDTMLRAAMLHRFGVSLRLVELRDELLERLAVHVRLFRDVLAPFVRNGVLHRLTEQPRTHGRGERVPAFQLDLGERSVVAVYRLPEGGAPDAVRPVGARADRDYTVTDLTTGLRRRVPGSDIEQGGLPLTQGEETSWLLLVEPAHPAQ